MPSFALIYQKAQKWRRSAVHKRCSVERAHNMIDYRVWVNTHDTAKAQQAAFEAAKKYLTTPF